jgi:hypothetical protein
VNTSETTIGDRSDHRYQQGNDIMITLLKSAMAASVFAAAGALPALADAASLDAFAARHFNSSVSVADRQTEPGSFVAVSTRGTADGSSLSERAAMHFNTSVSVADRQTVIAPVDAPDTRLDAFAAEHFNRSVSPADRQTEPL